MEPPICRRSSRPPGGSGRGRADPGRSGGRRVRVLGVDQAWVAASNVWVSPKITVIGQRSQGGGWGGGGGGGGGEADEGAEGEQVQNSLVP